MDIEVGSLDQVGLSGKVLLESKGNFKKLPSGLEIDPSYNWGVHVPTLWCLARVGDGSPLEGYLGCDVVVRYLSALNAMALGSAREHMTEKQLVRCQGKEYYLVAEDSVYGVFYLGELLPMWGKVFFHYLPSDLEKGSLFKMQGKEYSPSRGVVVFGNENFSVGDVIYFDNRMPVKLEHRMYSVGLTRDLYRIESSEILASG